MPQKPKANKPATNQAPFELDLHCRSVIIPQANGVPASFDETTRSFEADFATEEPVWSIDMRTWEPVLDLTLMSGCVLPGSGQIPMLDSHVRIGTAAALGMTLQSGTDCLIGSGRQLAVANGKLSGRIYFSSVEEAEPPYTKAREGHLTDVSLGYKQLDGVRIPAGTTGIVQGRSYTAPAEAPLNVITKWQPREISVCVFGADEATKIRSALADGNPPKIHKEVQTMDEKLRALLEAKGLPKTATEAEAWAFAENLAPTNTRAAAEPPAAPAAVQPGDEAIRAAIGAERTRVSEIDAMCARFECTDLAPELRTSGATVDQARAKVMEKISARSTDNPGPTYRPPIEMGLDSRDKFRAAVVDSLIIRSAHEAIRKSQGAVFEKPAPGALDLLGFSLRELCRESLRVQGLPSGGNALEMIGRALTTSDFPLILAAVANKSLMAGWETASETWQIWCAVGSVSDFKLNTAVRPSEGSDLDEVPEDTEYTYGTRSEQQEQYKVVTYGKLFALSRQTIINDDLGALTDVPAMHGESWARKIGDLAYAVLTANANMGDAHPLFSATYHSNVATGGDIGAVGVATMEAAVKAMKSQKDILGLRRLNIRPQYYLAPVSVEGASEVFFKTEKFSDRAAAATPDASDASSRVNIYFNTLTRVYEPRLDDDDDKTWYLAGPKGKTVKVFFLGGNQTPYMETKQGWNVDGVEYKVRGDAGAKAMDWKALYQNPNT